MAIFKTIIAGDKIERQALFGAPPGHDARALAELARQAGSKAIIAVLQDDLQAASLSAYLSFFAPGIAQLEFPAWDCLPYDRSSPSADILATRAATLSALIEPRTQPLIVITTINALTQKLPPRAVFATKQLELKAGATIERAALQQFLAANGYRRVTTVREPGDYALRGDIADLYPPDQEQPIRIDFFDTTIESLKTYDALTQLTTGSLPSLQLDRTAELVLDETAVARFRNGYRELFGAQLKDDPLYSAVSEGRAYAGVEHWLPQFYDTLDTLFHYLPDAPLWLGWQIREAATSRWAQVEDFYEARASLLQAMRKDRASAYKPLPPAQLYLSPDMLEAALKKRSVLEVSPFAPPEGGAALDAGGKRGRDFAPERQADVHSVYKAALKYIEVEQKVGRRTVLAAYSRGSADRLRHVLVDAGAGHSIKDVADGNAVDKLDKKDIGLAILPLEQGFTSAELTVLTEQDLLGDRLARPKQKKRRSDEFVIDLGALEVGDLVVHNEHGVGRFDGLVTLEIGGGQHDCLRLLYHNNDRLFLPVENLDLLSRYGGGSVDETGESTSQLDRLGGAGWQARRARVKKRLKDMADALLKIAAQRELQPAPVAEVQPGPYDEFCARFPYAETEDQARAISQSLDDLTRGRPMDRLVCGDVGFGKTEVALRAAFVAASAGLQVAVVVPTTLLARQHARGFATRFRGFPFKIAQLSRFVNAADSKVVKEGLSDGSVDIVIGTHALLASAIKFQRLGLVIVDEEQHFGVKQKEKLKALASSHRKADNEGVHVLTLSATPIPRTMQLALTGVRELSLIATPPVDRLAVRTTVLPFDPLIIREALMREHWRGGQSFCVAPHIEDLPKLAEQLRELVPELKIITAHGQLPPGQLDEIMGQFDDGQYDLLLATNIIESGLDIPRANTIIIHRADRFGLAQLYQLRGRVGRAKARGYAYLTYPSAQLLTPSAEARLKVMETLDTLGAGFQLASHDLDIRGAGNLLGEEQSGHIREVGIELYQEMLKEAVEAARRGELADISIDEGWSPQINLAMPVMLPESYVQDLSLRLSLYRRLADIKERSEVDAFAAELTDRFGPMPLEVTNLLATMDIKLLCRACCIEKLDAGPNGGVIAFRHNKFPAPDNLIAYIGQGSGTLKIRPDMKLVTQKVWNDPLRRLAGVKALLSDLCGLLPESKKLAA